MNNDPSSRRDNNPHMADEERQSPKPSEHAPQKTPRDQPPVVTSEQLMQGCRELWIDHEGEIYRLRVTSRGKLYLTK